MLASIYKKLERLAAWQVFAVLFLLAVLCTFGFEMRNRGLGPDIQTFDGRKCGYTAAEAYDFLHEIKADGRRLYAFSEATLDLIFPFIYGSMFIILLIKLWDRRVLLLVPVITVAADLLENTSAVYLASAFNEALSREEWIAANSLIVSFAPAFTITKWSGILILVSIVSLGIISFVVRALKRKRAE